MPGLEMLGSRGSGIVSGSNPLPWSLTTMDTPLPRFAPAVNLNELPGIEPVAADHRIA
jgi:hypothetical protein